MYQISVYYDGEFTNSFIYPNALEAVHAFDKCNDYAFANEVATYNLLEPSGKMHTKNFYRDGKVSVK